MRCALILGLFFTAYALDLRASTGRDAKHGGELSGQAVKQAPKPVAGAKDTGSRFATIAAGSHAEPNNVVPESEEEEEEEDAAALSAEEEEAAAKLAESKCDYAEIKEDILGGYDKGIRPHKGGPPEEVAIAIQVFTIGTLDSKSQTVLHDFLVKMTWEEARLKFNATCLSMRIDPKAVWKPDWYLKNAGMQMDDITGKEDVVVHSNGTVEYSVRVFGSLKCKMQFKHFPFDSQTCAVVIGSMFLGKEKQVFVQRGDKLKTVTFDCEEDEIGGSMEWEYKGFDVESDDDENTVRYNFSYQRLSDSYVKNFVFPTAMMFLMVQLGFVMDMRFKPALPARTAIAIIPVLILTTQTAAAKGQIPKIDYSTWLSDFLMISLIFMSYGLGEFVVAYYCVHHKELLESQKKTVPFCIAFGSVIDHISFYVFPFCSLVFFGVMLGLGYSY